MGNTQSLFFAIENNDSDKVAEILGSEPQLVHQRNGQGWTPLMVAAYFGHDGLVILLLGFGARLEDVWEGGTALMADPNHGYMAIQIMSRVMASLPCSLYTEEDPRLQLCCS